MRHSFTQQRSHLLHGEANWAVAAAWVQEAALAARTGVEGEGETRRLSLEGTPFMRGKVPAATPTTLSSYQWGYYKVWFPQEETLDPGLSQLLTDKMLTWQSTHTM